jgi:intracellular sulfur oxidation DsrE/DsrF family protein
MKKTCLFAVLVLSTAAIYAQVPASPKVNPIVQGFGSVWEVPFAAKTPDKKTKYNIVVDITDAASKPDTINLYIEAVATLINLHGVGGVPADRIRVVMVFHKMSTYSIFSNEKYKERFKVDNPNLPMLKALKDAGVEMYTCGQTLFRGKIPQESITPEVQISTSALTLLTEYQLKGYASINFK